MSEVVIQSSSAVVIEGQPGPKGDTGPAGKDALAVGQIGFFATDPGTDWLRANGSVVDSVAYPELIASGLTNEVPAGAAESLGFLSFDDLVATLDHGSPVSMTSLGSEVFIGGSLKYPSMIDLTNPSASRKLSVFSGGVEILDGKQHHLFHNPLGNGDDYLAFLNDAEELKIGRIIGGAEGKASLDLVDLTVVASISSYFIHARFGFYEGKFVAVAYYSGFSIYRTYIYTSSDAMTWSQKFYVASGIPSIAYANGGKFFIQYEQDLLVFDSLSNLDAGLYTSLSIPSHTATANLRCTSAADGTGMIAGSDGSDVVFFDGQYKTVPYTDFATSTIRSIAAAEVGFFILTFDTSIYYTVNGSQFQKLGSINDALALSSSIHGSMHYHAPTKTLVVAENGSAATQERIQTWGVQTTTETAHLLPKIDVGYGAKAYVRAK